MSLDEELIEAVKSGDEEAVASLLGSGASAQALGGPNSVSALHIAVGQGNLQVAKYLIEARAYPNSRDATGLTPMMLAAYQGFVQVAALLLTAGADVNARDHRGTTALLLAQGHAELVEMLLRAGADVNATSASGMTPLMYASNSGDIDCVRLCLAAGADAHQRDNRGWSATDYARHRKKWRLPALDKMKQLLIFGHLTKTSDPIVQLLQTANETQGADIAGRPP